MQMAVKDIQFQADAFLDYFSKGHSETLDEVFQFWANGKDFNPDDRGTIWNKTQQILSERSSHETRRNPASRGTVSG